MHLSEMHRGRAGIHTLDSLPTVPKAVSSCRIRPCYKWHDAPLRIVSELVTEDLFSG